MPVSIKGTNGGSVTLDAGTAASATTLTLPNTTGTVALTASPTFTGTVTATTVTSPSATALTIQSAGTTAVTVDTSQNVGIGTTSPSGNLEVKGASGQNIYVTYTGGSQLRMKSDSGDSGVGTTGSTSFLFLVANAEKARIDTSGNFLVGTTSVLGGTNKLCLLYDGNVSGGLLTQTSTNVGYTAAVFKNSSGTTIGSITTTTSATAFTTSSDYRLKENVQPFSGGLATISALKPVRYDWISDKSAGEGFIAHELQEIIPQAVHGKKNAVDDEGNIKPQGVDYSKIVVHLVAAIKELSAKNDALEARLVALEAK